MSGLILPQPIVLPGELAGAGLVPGKRYTTAEIMEAWRGPSPARAAASLEPAILSDGWTKAKVKVDRHENGSARLSVVRSRGRNGVVHTERKVRLGPNAVYAAIIHPDGTVTELGESLNLLTNIGRDWWSDNFGAKAAAGGQGSPATASSSTSLTATSTPWTASNLATPQLGLAGKVICVPITNITTTPVFGLIVSNTSSVATVDKWWTPDFAGTGTTPSSTAAFLILPGSGPGAFFMALTTDASAASASNTSLASEVTTNGGLRSKCTYAHTYGVATATHQVVFSITGTLTAIHRMGLFPTSKSNGADPMIFETVLNQDATVGNGDSLTVTDTITYSG